MGTGAITGYVDVAQLVLYAFWIFFLSIDFLDLVFQLEKEFKIKIPRGQLEKNARGDLAEDEFEKSGSLTADGLNALKDYLSEIPAEQFKANMKVNEIPMLFTVETFCKLVVAAVAQQQSEATVA